MVQVGETVTAGNVTVTGCVTVEPAEDTEIVAVFVTRLVLIAVAVVVTVGVNLM